MVGVKKKANDLVKKSVEEWFNPEDVSRWSELPPVEVLARILPPIMERAFDVELMANFILEHSEVDPSTITFCGGKITLKEIAEDMKLEFYLIERILRTVAAYRKDYLKRTNQSVDNTPDE